MNEWISVKDQLPKHREIVLVVDEVRKIISLARYREFGDLLNCDDEDDYFEVMNMDEIEIDYSVTHWRKLPSLLKHNHE